MIGCAACLRFLLPAAVVSVATIARESSVDTTESHLDALYRVRDDANAAREIDQLLRDGVAAHPGEYGLLWRAARVRWWEADGESGDRKTRLAKEGWDFGERAVRVNPDGVEGRYYAGICIGAYAEAVGVLRALREGLDGKFTGYVDDAIARAPDIDLGGPAIAKGRYWYDLPWPKRSLDRSAEILRGAIRRHPENLRARLYLAETELARGDAARARDTLAPVLGGDESYDPPEARRIRARARVLQRRIADRLG